jgi:hypothetical protein
MQSESVCVVLISYTREHRHGENVDVLQKLRMHTYLETIKLLLDLEQLFDVLGLGLAEVDAGGGALETKNSLLPLARIGFGRQVLGQLLQRQRVVADPD